MLLGDYVIDGDGEALIVVAFKVAFRTVCIVQFDTHAKVRSEQ